MGDRCSVRLQYLKSDEPVVMDVLGVDMFNTEYHADGDAVCDVEEVEVNYGWYNQFEELASKGVQFTGSHGAGGDYGSRVFVGTGGRVIYLDTNSDGDPIARLTLYPGQPPAAVLSDLVNADNFHKALLRVKAVFEKARG